VIFAALGAWCSTPAMTPTMAEQGVVVIVDHVEAKAVIAPPPPMAVDPAVPPAATRADENKPVATDANKDDAKKTDADKPKQDARANAPVPVPAHRGAVQFNFNVNLAPGLANQNVVEPQVRARLEPMLKVELSFACRAAKLNEDERRALITTAKKWFDDFVVDYAKHLDQRQQQMWLQGMTVIGGHQSGDSPRELVERGLQTVAAAALPQEKSAVYKSECDKRTAFYRQTTVDNLVNALDAKLNLSPEERQKITASLLDHWDASWAPQLDAFLIQSDAMPTVPNQWISPELTSAQRKVFVELSGNANQGVIFAGVFNGDITNIDDISLDDPAPEPATAKKD
jgi:hypothetical protein